MLPFEASIPIAIGRSKWLPSLRLAAGDRFIVMRCIGKSQPEFMSAERTLSLASRIVADGRPTVYIAGSPCEMSVSTVTGYALIPEMAAV